LACRSREDGIWHYAAGYSGFSVKTSAHFNWSSSAQSTRQVKGTQPIFFAMIDEMPALALISNQSQQAFFREARPPSPGKSDSQRQCLFKTRQITLETASREEHISATQPSSLHLLAQRQRLSKLRVLRRSHDSTSIFPRPVASLSSFWFEKIRFFHKLHPSFLAESGRQHWLARATLRPVQALIDTLVISRHARLS